MGARVSSSLRVTGWEGVPILLKVVAEEPGASQVRPSLPYCPWEEKGCTEEFLFMATDFSQMQNLIQHLHGQKQSYQNQLYFSALEDPWTPNYPPFPFYLQFHIARGNHLQATSP